MTNQQAAAKAKKRWGKAFYVRNGESFSSPDKRKAALDTVLSARARKKEIDDEVQRRLNEMDWYQELQKERRECVERARKTEGYAHYYRFSVSRQTAMGFHEILGQGDTWEEAFAQADMREGVCAA